MPRRTTPPPTESAALRFPATFVLPLLAAALASCEMPPTGCGEVPPGGGPRVIATRDQELCEIVRLRLEFALSELPDLEETMVQRWHDASWGWSDAKTCEGVVVRIREDSCDALADAAVRAVEDVRAHSTRSVAASCEDDERCLARGAGTGARLAVENALHYLQFVRANAPKTPNTGE